MKILVTGSAGHLGEALMRVLPQQGYDPTGLDIRPGPFTECVGSISDRAFLRQALTGVKAIVHTATLHKPHIATHTKQDFIDTNVTGTLALLEEAVVAEVDRFIFTSTTSAYGAALSPCPGDPAAWIDETTTAIPKNIYGASKSSAEDLCEIFARTHGLNCLILHTSRFFPEVDDSEAIRETYSDVNAKANEFLFRRVDLEDAVSAHERALQCAPDIGFAKYIISAPSPFRPGDLNALRTRPTSVVQSYYENFADTYESVGFRMFGDIQRVYVSDRARRDLGWAPNHDFGSILLQIASNQPIGSNLARIVGIKGYHSEEFSDGPYPVE